MLIETITVKRILLILSWVESYYTAWRKLEIEERLSTQQVAKGLYESVISEYSERSRYTTKRHFCTDAVVGCLPDIRQFTRLMNCYSCFATLWSHIHSLALCHYQLGSRKEESRGKDRAVYIESRCTLFKREMIGF